MQKGEERSMFAAMIRSYLVLLVLAVFPRLVHAEGISEACSSAMFDKASAEFFLGAESSIRAQVLTCYGEHSQIGLVRSGPVGDIRVQVLIVRELKESEVTHGEIPDALTCSGLTLREKRFTSSGRKLRRLFDSLRSIEVPAVFPPILYLDSTSYRLQVTHRGLKSEMGWDGLDSPKDFQKFPLGRWFKQLRRVFL